MTRPWPRSSGGLAGLENAGHKPRGYLTENHYDGRMELGFSRFHAAFLMGSDSLMLT